MKTKNIILQRPLCDSHYKVLKVTDSLEYSPGEILTIKQAQELCDSKFWKVTVQN